MSSVILSLLLVIFGFCLLTRVQAQPACCTAPDVSCCPPLAASCASPPDQLQPDACFSQAYAFNPFALPDTISPSNSGGQCAEVSALGTDIWGVIILPKTYLLYQPGPGVTCSTTAYPGTLTCGACPSNVCNLPTTTIYCNNPSLTIPQQGYLQCTPPASPATTMVVYLQDSNGYEYALEQQVGTGSCSVTAIAIGDPYFVGFWGQNFTVMGMPGNVYSVISDATVQINSLFIYLDNVECPKVGGQEIPNCINHHAGTYFGKLSISSSGGDQVIVTAGPGKSGFSEVTVNGKLITTGASFGTVDPRPRHTHPLNASALDHSPRTSIYVKRNNYRSLVIHAGLYEILIQNSDNYLDLTTVDVVCWDCLLKQVQPEGLLGRTWNQNVHNVSDIEVVKYQESEANLFGCKFEKDKFCSKAK